jgi:hypothetical protein
MRKLLSSVLAITLACPALFAETVEMPRYEHASKRSNFWKASLAMLAASSAADAASSWGRLEANPLLRSSNGRFGWHGIALKAAIFGGVAGAQYLLLKKNPGAEKWGAATNIVLSGVLTSAAISNHQRAQRAAERAAAASAARAITPSFEVNLSSK